MLYTIVILATNLIDIKEMTFDDEEVFNKMVEICKKEGCYVGSKIEEKNILKRSEFVPTLF